MTKKIIYISFAIFVFQFSFSQKKAAPIEEDITLAKELKEQFPKDHIALVRSADYLSFGYDKKNNKVTVDHNLEETLINLDSRSDIQLYTFYDGQSKITNFNVKYRTQKEMYIYPKDEAYTSNDLFHNDSRVKYLSLDFPLLGYKYHTTINKKYLDVKYLTKLYFNGSYPIINKTIKVEVPVWLNLELKEMNFEGFSIEKTVETNSKTNFKTYTYTLNDIPAMYKEKNAPGPTYIYPHVLILAKSFTYNDITSNLFNNTQDLYNWYVSLTNALENDNSVIKNKVIELTKTAKTDQEKIKNIYYWVQDNIRYIAFEDGIAGFKPDEASSVFNKRYGDCKGMANLTKQMLIEAGYDARLTWIGTKRIAYDYSIPSLSVDNHMICTLFKDGKTIYLDGTEKFNAFGEYADRIQGKQVLIENGEDYIIKTVPNSNAGFNKEITDYEFSITGEKIVGKASKKYQGESRSSLLYYLNSIKNDKKENFLEYYLNNGDGNIKVNNINTSNLENRESDIDFSYDITLNSAISSFDNIYYIDLDFDKEFSGYNFEDRNTDYVLTSKKHIESKTTLKIPEGYTASELPQNISFKNDNYDLSVQFKKGDNSIVYTKKFVINNSKINKQDFEDWNSFNSKLNKLYKEQIILTKQ